MNLGNVLNYSFSNMNGVTSKKIKISMKRVDVLDIEHFVIHIQHKLPKNSNVML